LPFELELLDEVRLEVEDLTLPEDEPREDELRLTDEDEPPDERLVFLSFTVPDDGVDFRVVFVERSTFLVVPEVDCFWVVCCFTRLVLVLRSLFCRSVPDFFW
jgi:hypothetical protein